MGDKSLRPQESMTLGNFLFDSGFFGDSSQITHNVKMDIQTFYEGLWNVGHCHHTLTGSHLDFRFRIPKPNSGRTI